MEASRKKIILDAAKRLFFHYGPQKTTMHDIAREARCAVGSVYLDFPSKEAILGELSLAEYVSVHDAMELAGRVRARFDERLSAVLVARTKAFFAVTRHGAHTPELFHCRVPCVHDARARFEQKESELFTRLLLEGDASLDKKSAARIACTMQASIAALSPPWVFEKGEARALELAEDLAAVLSKGALEASRTRAASKKQRRAR